MPHSPVCLGANSSSQATSDNLMATSQISAADTLSATISTSQPFRIGSRSTGSNWKGEIDEVRIYDRVLEGEDVVAVSKGDPVNSILSTPAEQRKEGDHKVLVARYLGAGDKNYKGLVASHQKLVKQHADLGKKPVTSMIMQDNPANKMRMTYILDRGAYDSPKKDEVIKPGVPEALPPMPAMTALL